MSYLPYGIIYKDPETDEMLYANILGNVVSSFGKDIPIETFLETGKKALELLRRALTPEEFMEYCETFMKKEIYDMDEAVKGGDV